MTVSHNLLSMLLAVTLASAGMPSCSSYKPKFVHLDFADDIYIAGPTMGELATGHPKIDSSEKNCELFFLVNETNPKYYADSVIERFIDTSWVIREAMTKGYHELRVHFYHRGGESDELLKTRDAKVLDYLANEMISEYGWMEGRPEGTIFYDHGRVRGEDIQLEDMRKKKKP
ncbi:MAG TPA: hypothetical protein VGS79_08510 [Puia sp.]|nr:hypothetical protein [Puia sp.]